MLGVLGAFESGWTWRGWWAGLAVTLLVTTASAVLLGVALGTAQPALLLGVGWLSAVAWLSVGRPEGDVVVPGSSRGYSFLIGGLLAFLPGALVGLRRRHQPAPPEMASGFTSGAQPPIAGE